MAFFVSNVQWDVGLLDFNAGLRVPNTQNSTAGGTFAPFPDPLTFDGVSYTVASHVLQIETELTISFGTSIGTFNGSGLTFDSQGLLTGGTGQSIGLQENAVLSYGMTGASFSAVDFGVAFHTADNADDIALFNTALAGQDFATLSNLKDRFDSGSGRDLIVARNGADRIDAGTDDDIVLAGTGSDRVTGGTGNDILFGDTGNDLLDGGFGRDFLAGEKGSDQLSGGKGPDFFVFSAHGGSDIVTDFVAADDQIIIRSGAVRMADITIQKVGSDIVISFADVSITLLNVARSQVSSADFIFGGNSLIDNAASHFFTGWDYFA